MEPYHKAEVLNMRAHPELSEKWVQEIISLNTSIIGLGDLDLLAKEKKQPSGGRLDLLFQDPETNRRYEVELQLGATDERHIIRTIEYWDIERKRYPQYDHCAVLIAEDITSRFLNILQLFNGSIPFIAIQMKAIKVNGSLSLVFTRVVDELKRGLVGDDETEESAPATRADWEQKASKQSLAMIDTLFDGIRKLDPSLSLRFNKRFIGIEKNHTAYNFVRFVPKKTFIRVAFELQRSDDIDKRLEAADLDTLPYSVPENRYRLRISDVDIKTKLPEIASLLALAYNYRTGETDS